ncbi:DUF1367 family protein [Pusillimonas sp. ANT_WB101]|uniref:DUF1367 family protein n=1 Tax=Pusillimonas sp. ANT_WB101 TaxID=2597356 RepID=UPI0011EC30A5|nr:DUF1367 family protein [Pusillimonas sp. ANT_WB101]KAA0910662.1 DUF1367 family protein [Pusillimonas sp. ANT_WB101]
MELLLIKTPQGAFIPFDDDQAEACKRFKVGATIKANVSAMRNYQFHKKFFSMLDVGFDAWEPPEAEHRGLPVQKNKERFRKDCIIAAGFYEPVANINGDVRAEAKSISFARMDDIEFERVYSAVADVILQRVLRNYTRADLDAVVDRMMGYL